MPKLTLHHAPGQKPTYNVGLSLPEKGILGLVGALGLTAAGHKLYSTLNRPEPKPEPPWDENLADRLHAYEARKRDRDIIDLTLPKPNEAQEIVDLKPDAESLPLESGGKLELSDESIQDLAEQSPGALQELLDSFWGK